MPMIQLKWFVGFILLLALSSVVAQEFVYVTDSLRLRLYSQATDSSEVLVTIESGDSVEVLEKQNAFSRVVTNDGIEGWVKSAFLVENPPEKLLYYAVGEQNKQLQAEIETLKNTPQHETSVVDVSEYEKQITQLQTTISEQQEINQSLQQQLAEANSPVGAVVPTSTILQAASTPNKFEQTNWLMFALALGILLLGFLLGIKLSARRMRKRLHGFVLK